MARLIRKCRTLLCLAALGAGIAVEAVPLWEIKGTDNRILMLGSVHFLRADDYPLPESVDAAYRQADVIVMELALDQIEPLQMQSAFMKLAVDPRGRTLEDLIGAAAWREADDLASDMDIDLKTLQPFEPWFAALQVSQLRLLQLGFDGSYGIEKTVMRRAAEDGKPIMGLETLDEQLGAFDNLPADVQRDFLLQTLEEAGTIGDELDTVVAAWRRGDIATLDELLLASLAAEPEVYEHLLVERNRRWIRKILAMTNDGRDYLIVFGALHLIGPDSVPVMLEEAGVKTRKLD